MLISIDGRHDGGDGAIRQPALTLPHEKLSGKASNQGTSTVYTRSKWATRIIMRPKTLLLIVVVVVIVRGAGGVFRGAQGAVEEVAAHWI